MSELNSLLQDILNNEENPNPDEIQEDPTLEDPLNINTENKDNVVSNEDVNSVKTIINNTIKKEVFSQETIAKFNNLCKKLTIADTIKNTAKVEKSIVMEAYAAMPAEGMDYKVELLEAKLTSSPSVINKSIFEKTIHEFTEAELEEFKGIIREQHSVIKEMEEVKSNVVETLAGYKDKLVNMLPKVNYIILYKNPEADKVETYNVFESPVETLIGLRPEYIEYDRYKTKEFSKGFYSIFEKVIRRPSGSFLVSVDNTEYSIVDLISNLDTFLTGFVNNNIITTSLTNVINPMIDDPDGFDKVKMSYLNMDELNSHIETVRNVIEVLEDTPNIFDVLIEHIEFLL